MFYPELYDLIHLTTVFFYHIYFPLTLKILSCLIFSIHEETPVEALGVVNYEDKIQASSVSYITHGAQIVVDFISWCDGVSCVFGRSF